MLYVKRLCKVKMPVRSTEGSAGYDFFVPDDYKGGKFRPGETIKIPAGVQVKIPEGHALVAFSRSSVALNRGLFVSAQIVDRDYQGELHFVITNGSWKFEGIKAGEKLIQFCVMPVLMGNVEEVKGDLFNSVSGRGEGGFGSTGQS